MVSSIQAFLLCNECFNLCSTFVQMVSIDRKDLPSVINPDNCVDGCRGCQNKCPESAISYFGDDATSAGTICGCGCTSC